MQDIGKKILLYIDKIENNTIHISEVLQAPNNTDIQLLSNLVNNIDTSRSFNLQNDNQVTNNTLVPYDSSGAAKYIIVVVLLYGFGIIFFIGSQVRSTKKYSDEVDGVNAEKILKSMETEIFTKEVLEKLSNKEHREKAWKIYLTDSKNPTGDSMVKQNLLSPNGNLFNGENLKEIDKEAVESIERKLKTLKTYHETNEIETIKEMLKAKFKQSHHSNDFKISPNKRKSSQKKRSKNNLSTPMLILQTDVDGLMKLKETKEKTKKVISSESVNKSLCSLMSNDDDNSSESVKFDLFEVSEQITSV